MPLRAGKHALLTMIVGLPINGHALPRGLLHPHLCLADLRTSLFMLFKRAVTDTEPSQDRYCKLLSSLEEYPWVCINEMPRKCDGILLHAALSAALLGDVVNLGLQRIPEIAFSFYNTF